MQVFESVITYLVFLEIAVLLFEFEYSIIMSNPIVVHFFISQ